MSKIATWMPLYPADWDSDTRHLDCEQDGAYGRLVRHYWRNGPLPDDDAMLARVVGMERARWRKVRPVIAAFFEIREGRWFHKRVEAELQKAHAVSERRREAGLLGGRPRKQLVSANESKPKANGYANGKQNETHARVTVMVDSSELTTLPSQIGSADSQVGSTAVVIPLDGRAAR